VRASLVGLLTFALLAIAPASRAVAQEAGPDAVDDSARADLSVAPATDPPAAPALEHRVDGGLLRAGVGLLLGAWLGNIPITGLSTFMLFFESAYPCYESFCGIWETYLISFIPIAGPAIWGGMILDTAESGACIVGFVLSALQALGLGMLIAGAVGYDEPILVAPVIGPQQAGALVELAF
jgi:hypothetical protein